jgi:hypothetical protein
MAVKLGRTVMALEGALYRTQRNALRVLKYWRATNKVIEKTKS